MTLILLLVNKKQEFSYKNLNKNNFLKYKINRNKNLCEKILGE